MNNAELIKLFKPCEQLCKDCGSKCCYNKQTGIACKDLVEGKCTKRNKFCLMFYCQKIEDKYPEIVEAVKKEAEQIYPYAHAKGIHMNFKWEEK